MMKKLKKISLLIIVLGLLMTNIPIVEAVVSWNYDDSFDLSDEDDDEDKSESLDYPMISSKDISGTCSINRSAGVTATKGHNVYVYMYNQADEDIIKEGFVIDEEDMPKAGTAVGITIKEQRIISWDMNKIRATLTLTTKKLPIHHCKYELKENAGEDLGDYVNYKQENDFDGIDMLRHNNTTPLIMKNTLSIITRPINESLVCEDITVESNEGCPLEAGNCKLKSDTVNAITGEQTTITVNVGSEPIDLKNAGVPEKYLEEAQKLYEECQKKIIWRIDYVSSFNDKPAYNIRMTDSNDVNGDNPITILGSQALQKVYNKDNNLITDAEDYSFKVELIDGKIRPTSDKRTYEFYYEKGLTCMNVKTGKARYLDVGSEELCSSDEITIEPTTLDDGTTHWHYFIPLNVKVTKGIILDMIKNEEASEDEGILDKKHCLTIMKKNYISATNPVSEKTPYNMIIKPNNGVANAKFKGDFKCYNCDRDNPTWTSKSQSLDYSEIDKNGCIMATTEEIKVKQLFYNEMVVATGGEIKEDYIKGFNFYYKPIDIAKENQVDIIFPNGVKKDILGNLKTATLWDDWYKEQTVQTTDDTLDLSKSFEEATYHAYNISASAVRNYNKENPYTSWAKMNLDGTSKFIDDMTVTGETDYNVIERRYNVLKKGIYKLGCGPSNINEYLDEAKTQPNPLYQKECAT